MSFRICSLWISSGPVPLKSGDKQVKFKVETIIKSTAIFFSLSLLFKSPVMPRVQQVFKVSLHTHRIYGLGRIKALLHSLSVSRTVVLEGIFLA